MNGLTTPAVSGGPAARRTDGAAARLYVEYRERIYRFCYGRLRSREEAEDAVQNVFMRVHMALDRGVVPQYEAAWLYKIAHNVCLSRIDSNARRSGEELHAFDEDDMQIASPDVSREELAGLGEALEAMPHNLRTAILLREWQGLSYAEIAVAMGLSVSAVETLIFRARRHLAWALEHPGEKPKSVVGRLLDLLGLGSLRSFFLGAGSAAKLAAGAALLALGGGTAAVAIATSSHARHTPSVAHVPKAAVPVQQHGGTHLARHAAERVSDTSGAGQTTPVAAVAPAAGSSHPAEPAGTTPSVSGTSTVSAPTAVTPAAPGQSPVTTTAALPKVTVPTVTAPTAQAPTVTVPTVTVPTVTAPAASAPTVSVPTVSVPTVSVPTVSVPTTTLPVGGGIVG